MESKEKFRAYLDIVEALIYILNDESPDIRAYIVNQGLTSVLDTDDYNLDGANLGT